VLFYYWVIPSYSIAFLRLRFAGKRREKKKRLKYFNKLKICNFLCCAFMKQKQKWKKHEKKNFPKTCFENWHFCFCSAVCDIHAFNINWIYLSPFISDHCFAFSFWPVWCCKRNYKWLNAYWPQIVERVLLFFYLVAIVPKNVWRKFTK
jgi:hypothetical protein